MSRLSEEERLAHPEARLFSPVIWATYFEKRGLSDVQLQLMRNPLDVGSDAEREVKSKQQLRNWLCVLVGHRGASAEELGIKAASLHLPLSIIINGALSCNRQNILAQYGEEVLQNPQNDYLLHAVCSGSIESLLWLKRTYTEVIFQQMLQDQEYWAFVYAAQYGYLDILKWFTEQAAEQFQLMITARNYGAFRDAAANGYFDILKWFAENAHAQLQAMIVAARYGAFRDAAGNGHLDILKWFAEKARDQLQEMIAADNYYAFMFAAGNGHRKTLIWLEEKAPEQFRAMIAANNYYAFIFAAGGGSLDTVIWLAEKAPLQFRAMVAAEHYYAFRYAAEQGHVDILKWLAEQVPEQLQAMIAAMSYSAFISAAGNGYLHILDWLAEQQSPEQRQMMIAAENYNAFSFAAESGHLRILDWLAEQQSSEQFQMMIAYDNYYVFRYAAENGCLDILHWFEEKAFDQLPAMIAADNYSVLRHVPDDKKYFYLSYPNVFAYAEMHYREYGEAYVRSFIQKKLSELHAQCCALKMGDLHAVFDLADLSEAKLCFYILRNIIRQNNPLLLDELLFLIGIPAVRALAEENSFFAGEIGLGDLVQDHIKARLKKDLQDYIDSIQSDKRFEHYYFKGKNREINHLLAKQLLSELEDGTPLSELFQKVKEKRAHLQTKFPCHPHKHFPISAILNNIIKKGQIWRNSVLISVARTDASSTPSSSESRY